MNSNMEVLRHFAKVSETLNLIPKEQIDSFVTSLDSIRMAGKTLFVAGNGGSYAIAEHIATDFAKGLLTSTGSPIRCLSIGSNGPLLSAISNDMGYESSISIPLQIYAQKGDAVLLISSSGASRNIISGVEIARKLGLVVLALSGFGKSELVKGSDFFITIESEDYQVIEDCHAVVGHALFKELVSRS